MLLVNPALAVETFASSKQAVIEEVCRHGVDVVSGEKLMALLPISLLLGIR